MMFTHTLTSVSRVFDDLKNVYLTFCKIKHFILISSFMIKIPFCFSEPCYIRLEIKTFLSQKGQSFTVTGSPIFQPMMKFVDFVF